MSRQSMINLLIKARPDVPKDFWSVWTDDELTSQVNLVKLWMTQHAREVVSI